MHPPKTLFNQFILHVHCYFEGSVQRCQHKDLPDESMKPFRLNTLLLVSLHHLSNISCVSYQLFKVTTCCSQDQTALERHDAEIDEYNNKFARAPRDLTQQIQEDWVLLSRLFSGRFNFYKLLVVVTLLIAVLYVVSPVDLLPDSMGG